MTSPVESKYLNRVRALLAKAEATEFPAEAEECTARALRLMSQYGIDAAQLRAQGSKAEPVHERVVITNPRAKVKAHLLNALAENMNCRMLLQHRKRSMVGTGHLFGFPDDIERLKLAYASILVQLESALRRVEVPLWESPRAFRSAWAMGYVHRVGERLAEAKKTFTDEACASNGAFALVLADQSRAVTARMHQEFPAYGNIHTRSSSEAGRAAGYAAGDRADVGQTRVSGRRTIGS